MLFTLALFSSALFVCSNTESYFSVRELVVNQEKRICLVLASTIFNKAEPRSLANLSVVVNRINTDLNSYATFTPGSATHFQVATFN